LLFGFGKIRESWWEKRMRRGLVGGGRWGRITELLTTDRKAALREANRCNSRGIKCDASRRSSSTNPLVGRFPGNRHQGLRRRPGAVPRTYSAYVGNNPLQRRQIRAGTFIKFCVYKFNRTTKDGTLRLRWRVESPMQSSPYRYFL